MAFIFCQPEIYRNELYQDKIFMQGVRPIGADNKIFPSEQAPTEYFIIHSCMSHSNSKIVAISTVKAGDTTYFSLGTEWDKITDTYGLDVAGQNMFDYFNKPALDDAINAGKEIRFSHNPEAYGECALKWEWDYLQEKHGYFALEKKGDFWYATK